MSITPTHTIAMWSGPRNLSTAMMRAWENRSNTVVWDEPFYAYYLAQTQRPDPMADEVLEQGETQWQAVVDRLLTPPASGLQYHKHITTHILEGDSLDWLLDAPGMQHVFLIREPERVVASFNRLFDAESESDLVEHIGFHQQLRIFNAVEKHGERKPLVIDSTRFLADPQKQLQHVCEELGIEFEAGMLSWPAGARSSDGCWGAHWYHSVEKSTAFGPAPTTLPELNQAQQRVASLCRAPYEHMLLQALT